MGSDRNKNKATIKRSFHSQQIPHKSRFSSFFKKYLVEIIVTLLCAFILWVASTLISIKVELAIIQTRIEYLEAQIVSDDDHCASSDSFLVAFSKIETRLALLEQHLKHSE